MPELEEQLRRLGAAIEFPSTPSLTRAVVDRIGAEPTRRRQGLPVRRIALALAAVLVAVQVVNVNGSPGYGISGHPHGFAYRDPNQRGLEEDFRLAGNTLLWEQGGLTLRIESALSREQALAIARTVR